MSRELEKKAWRVQTIYICEDNPIVQQDLREIIRGFDQGIDIQILPQFPDRDLEGVRAGEGTAMIVNADRRTFGAMDFIQSFESNSGKVICIGVLGPGAIPPDSWIKVDAPFTTNSIVNALLVAQNGHRKGADSER